MNSPRVRTRQPTVLHHENVFRRGVPRCATPACCRSVGMLNPSRCDRCHRTVTARTINLAPVAA